MIKKLKNRAAVICPNCGIEMVRTRFEIEDGWILGWLCECDATKVMINQAIIERLADLEHQKWALWTEYMLDNLDEGHIAGWRRQIATPYDELTEQEKDMDRDEARKIIACIQ